jgi:hypothetical protein
MAGVNLTAMWRGRQQRCRFVHSVASRITFLPHLVSHHRIFRHIPEDVTYLTTKEGATEEKTVILIVTTITNINLTLNYVPSTSIFNIFHSKCKWKKITFLRHDIRSLTDMCMHLLHVTKFTPLNFSTRYDFSEVHESKGFIKWVPKQVLLFSLYYYLLRIISFIFS